MNDPPFIIHTKNSPEVNSYFSHPKNMGQIGQGFTKFETLNLT